MESHSSEENGRYREVWKEIRMWRTLSFVCVTSEFSASYKVFSFELTLTIYSQDIGLTQKLSENDIAAIVSQFEGKSASENVEMINKLLQGLPKSLLFVLRTTYTGLFFL